jgi:hypothetical protein
VAPGAISTLNSGKGPLLAPAFKDNGALVRKGLSLTVKKGEDVVKLSPFKKIVVLERFVSVASNVTVVPAAPVSVTWVSVISRESALARPDSESKRIVRIKAKVPVLGLLRPAVLVAASIRSMSTRFSGNERDVKMNVGLKNLIL